MTAKKTRLALGRGLSNLIPLDSPDKNIYDEILELSLKKISVNPFQARLDFNDDDLKNLAYSIDNQGLLQPIVVRKNGDKYEIISGERRFRAFQLLKKDTIPGIIKTKVSDNKMLELALVENIQRENLNEIEIAIAYKKLLFDCGLSHQELSDRVGKSRSAITNALRLLNLPDKIKNLVRVKKISMGHARALLSISNPHEQYELAKRIISDNLSVRDIEKQTKKKNPQKKKIKNKNYNFNSEDPDLNYQQEQLRYHFGTDVKIVMNKNNKGKIEIAYYNKDDLDRVLNIILTK